MIKNKIHLIKIEIENFLCFKDSHEFVFHTTGVHRIYGKNLDLKPLETEEDYEYHNSGSGKSSFLAAISFGLFGEIAKETNKNSVINKIAKKNCRVSIEFIKNNKKYRIDRYRKYTKFASKLFLYKIEKNKQIDESLDDLKLTQEKIENILMMNYDTFIKVVLMSRDGAKDFLELSNSQRTDQIESVIRLDKFYQLEKKLRTKLSKIRKDSESNYITLTENKSALKTLKIVIKKQIKNIKDKKETIQNNIDKIKKEINDIKNIFNENSNNDNLDEIINKSKKYYNYLINISEKITRYNKMLDELRKDKNDISKKCKNFFSLSKIIIKRKERLFSISNKEIFCIKCGEIQNKNEIENEIKENKTYINEVKEEKNELKKIINYLINSYREFQKKSEIEKEEINVMKKINFSISDTLKKIVQKDFKEGKFNFINKLDNLKKELLEKEKELVSITIEEILDTRKHILEINKKINKNEKLKVKLDKQLKIGEFWIDIFDNKNENSIKAFILSKIIPVYNVILQSFLNKIFDRKMFINFDKTFKESIRYNDELYEFKELSTGERKQINILINFTILSIVRLNLNSFNVLFLDEIFTSLDSMFIKKVINTLKDSFLQDSVLYVISHDNIDYLNVDSKITIQKENKESSIIIER